MKIAISEITTYPAPLEAELAAYAAAGFSAVELSLEKVQSFLVANPIDSLQQQLHRQRLTASGAIGLAPAGPALLLSTGQVLTDYLASLQSQLSFCEALGIGVLGVGADARRWLATESWKPNAVKNLRGAAAMADDHGVTLAVEFMSLGEPIGPFVLDTLADTLDLVEEAGHPALGISIDFFHHFRGGGTAAELRAMSATRIANVHFTDVAAGPVETLGDSNRVLPGEGVAPIAAYRDAILTTHYQGYWTLELLNPDLWQLDVTEAAALCARATGGFVVENRR